MNPIWTQFWVWSCPHGLHGKKIGSIFGSICVNLGQFGSIWVWLIDFILPPYSSTLDGSGFFCNFIFFSLRCLLIFLHNFHLTSYFDLHHKWLQKYFLLFWYGLLLGPKYSTRVIERMSCEQNKSLLPCV